MTKFLLYSISLQYVASYPAITIWKARSKVKKLDRDHACLCTSGVVTIFCGIIYVVIDHPGGPFMLNIIGPHAWVGLGPFMSMDKRSGWTKYDDISGLAGPSMLS